MRGPEDQEGRQDARAPGKSAASQLAVPLAHNPHSVPNDPSVSAILQCPQRLGAAFEGVGRTHPAAGGQYQLKMSPGLFPAVTEGASELMDRGERNR